MQRNIISMVKGSKLASFHRVIVEAELNIDAFEITKEEDAPGIKGKGSPGDAGIGTIKVMYKPTDVSAHYRDGVVPPAHLQFESDLKLNLFKTH